MPELERARAAREQTLQVAKDESMSRMMKDLAVDRVRNPNAALLDRWDPDEEDDDDDTDVNIIDRSEFGIEIFCVMCADQSEFIDIGEEPWPGQYIDVTRMRRRDDEGVTWPRPT